jgi:hypothetical protein
MPDIYTIYYNISCAVIMSYGTCPQPYEIKEEQFDFWRIYGYDQNPVDCLILNMVKPHDH